MASALMSDGHPDLWWPLLGRLIGAARAGRCGGIYSMGIRQAVHQTLGSRADLHDLVDLGRPGERALSTAAYHRTLRSVQWCLTAPGYGFGARIVDYLACGCIPVVVRPARTLRVLLPFEPELDYDAFGIVLPFEDLPSLPELLRGMPEATLRAKRHRLKELHRDFLWDDAYGRAFEAVRAATLGKVRRARGSTERT